MSRQVERPCEGCGVLFEAKRSDHRFHDARCKAQHWRDVRTAEERAALDPLGQALIRAFSLRVAGSVEAPSALRALLPLLRAEVEPSTPLTPASPTPANDDTSVGVEAAPSAPWHARVMGWALRRLGRLVAWEAS
jgi:hypothetical protein